MSDQAWSANDIPTQKGRVAVVTGSTSGIGKEAARALAQKEATVVLAVRNVSKGEAVAKELRAGSPNAVVAVLPLDLSNLSSVRAFSSQFLSDYDRLDLLINNAGIMMCPYATTDDGFEIQIGTNHFGHFALTGLLMPALKSTPDSRVVVVSSGGHKFSKLDLSDLNWEKRKYSKSGAYADSKLANLYFAYELARRLNSEGGNPMVTSAHPGWTETELQRHSLWTRFFNIFFAQEAPMGALPTLRAAVDNNASPGDYFGPEKFFELHGAPIKVESSEKSHHVATAQKLWALSEELTGVKY